MELTIFITVIMIIAALACRPIRKAVGLLFIILGIIECLSLIGLVIGIPSIIIGGILYHIGGNK